MADVRHLPDAILVCSNLSRSFGALKAVNDLSFSVRRGEVLGIGGPNGAGKTTLFELVSGFTAPDAGTVKFDGEDITGLQPHVIAGRGMARMFQSATTFPTLTVYENVLVGAAYGRSHLRFRIDQQTRKAAEDALELAGLTSLAQTIAGTLPVIDRKRLMLASALAMSPKLVLMDEPVGGLTPQETGVVASLVHSMTSRRITVILIEHVMRFMLSLSHRVLILHQGAKLFEGSPSQFLADQRVREVYLGEEVSKSLQREAALS